VKNNYRQQGVKMHQHAFYTERCPSNKIPIKK
jgi:hypothetical protein